jgi:hypothetical protein
MTTCRRCEVTQTREQILRFQLLGTPMPQREEAEPPRARKRQIRKHQAKRRGFELGATAVETGSFKTLVSPRGIRGGLFIDRDQALRFVRAENGNRPGEFVIVGGVLELDMSKASATTQRQGDAERRVA